MIKKWIPVVIALVILTGCQVPDENQNVEAMGTEQEEKVVIDQATNQEANEQKTSKQETQETDERIHSDSTDLVSAKPFLMTTDTNGLKKEDLDVYNIHVYFDPDQKTLACEQRVVYKNKEDLDLDTLVFQVLPNAYKSLETAPVLFGDIDSIYPNGFGEGYLDFSEVLVDGKPVDYDFYGADDTLMSIGLESPLSPKESVEIEMVYTVKIPPAFDRFGYNDTTFNIANWYPVAAVYDNGWKEDTYLPIGDPFYTDMASYKLVYNVPKNYEIASTGVRSKLEHDEADRKLITYEADFVRDTAWLASDSWNVHSEDVDGTMVRSYYFGEPNFSSDKAIETARHSLEVFNGIYGPYPYSELAVVATDFPSGMEYPAIVMIAKDRYKASRLNALESVIAHEIGHQWWYGVVGNDQIDEAWLDESLTVFSTAQFFGQKYGEDAYESYVNSYRNRYENRKSEDGDGVVSKPLTEFENWSDYSNLVYRKGMLFIDALCDEYGKENVLDFMKNYYEAYKFKTATTDDFIRLGVLYFGDDFKDLADVWIFNGVN